MSDSLLREKLLSCNLCVIVNSHENIDWSLLTLQSNYVIICVYVCVYVPLFTFYHLTLQFFLYKHICLYDRHLAMNSKLFPNKLVVNMYFNFMTFTKYDVEKFSGLNDFRLWKLKMCGLLIQKGLLKAFDIESMFDVVTSLENIT